MERQLQRFYHKSANPNYYNDYCHKNKHPMTCEVCGKVITCQMYSHLNSNRCKLKRQEIEIEKLTKQLEELKLTE